MSIPMLFPGQDYLTKEYGDQSREVFVYAYRSQQGAFFTCTGATEDEVKEKCMKWLIRHERH